MPGAGRRTPEAQERGQQEGLCWDDSMQILTRPGTCVYCMCAVLFEAIQFCYQRYRAVTLTERVTI